MEKAGSTFWAYVLENPDGRFYINLWTLIPHAKLDPTPEQLSAYEALETDPADFTGWMREYFARAENPDEQMKIYCASMTSLDTAIGRLLDYLDQKGLSENTIIFYTSDNGPEDYRVRNAANAGVGFSNRARVFSFSRAYRLQRSGVPGALPAFRGAARATRATSDAT